MRTRDLWRFVLLFVAVPGWAQASDEGAQASNEQARDIVVEAPRTGERAALWNQVRTVTGRSVSNDPIARFQDPVCLGSLGLGRDVTGAILDRMIEVAEESGIRTAGNPCDPNVLVLFVDHSREEMRKLAAKGHRAFAGLSHQAMRKLMAEPGPAQAWNLTEVRSRDGDPVMPGTSMGVPPTLKVGSMSRMAASIRQDIVGAVVVIDRQAVIGKSPRQIADYAAMRTYVRTTPPLHPSAETILSLFEGEGTAPTGLTAIDRGVLRGLYAAPANSFARTGQAKMVSVTMAERAAAEAQD
ncbi:hypothetical protein LK533_06210 [Sphingomonas sp. PL-96]|uniref:hypothetical protein n=1 Tax=Sphingomonas sp. PL-96 TaxID=2887201 RepID=UPI001E5FA3F6|nr:hypothetical protein [Sphingomonas sp. PL-96]MCC2976267.1 hypothetical protein [Sphingomonas sp. PL-96]